MADWTIEPLTADVDIEAILTVERASFTNPWTREMYQAELQHDGVAFFALARIANGEIVGFCAVWRVVDEIHINNLAVLPGFRRQGIGEGLIRRVLHDATRLGATRALLEVRRSNDDARRLYERLGFTVAGVRRKYYSQPVEDALVLWREQLESVGVGGDVKT